MNITIIGTGHMAEGIGTQLVAGKHSVTILGKDESEAKALAQKLGGDTTGTVLGNLIDSDVVIFALPYSAIPEVIEKHKSQLAGKILVDISNPVDFKTLTLIPPAGTSGAETIAQELPQGAKLIKAFNTTSAGTLINGKVDGHILDVFMAGDDQASKDTLKKIIEESGMRALDAGPLANARHLEGFSLIHILIQQQINSTFMSAIKILT